MCGKNPAAASANEYGDRDVLRPLFELAEDSAAELDSYRHAGRVLVARRGTQIVGHLQRQGFRMRSVERDAFTEASGYPPGSEADGIPLRDRVWLDIELLPHCRPVSESSG